MLTRVAAEDTQLKRLFIPKGMTIEFASTALHQDKEYRRIQPGEICEWGCGGLSKYPRRALHLSGSNARFGGVLFFWPSPFWPLEKFLLVCFC